MLSQNCLYYYTPITLSDISLLFLLVDLDSQDSGNLGIDNLYSDDFGEDTGLTEEWDIAPEDENITIIRRGDERGQFRSMLCFIFIRVANGFFAPLTALRETSNNCNPKLFFYYYMIKKRPEIGRKNVTKFLVAPSINWADSHRNAWHVPDTCQSRSSSISSSVFQWKHSHWPYRYLPCQ